MKAHKKSIKTPFKNYSLGIFKPENFEKFSSFKNYSFSIKVGFFPKVLSARIFDSRVILLILS